MFLALLLAGIIVVDGDTVAIPAAGSGVIEKVRLIGVDAPETHHAKCEAEAEAGKAAAARLGELIAEAQAFTLDRHGRDAYGRTLAHLFLDGENAGDRLIAEGYARVWRGRSSDWCR